MPTTMPAEITSSAAGSSWLQNPYVVSVLTFLQNNWLWILIVCLIALVVFFFLILPMIRKMRNAQKKIKETADLKKDLMVWHNLSQLVRGGKDAQEAKADFSYRIGLIRDLFAMGLKLLAENHRKLYSAPWFLMVGEPASGKSTLMQSSDLDLVPSVQEDPEAGADSEHKSVPLRFWMGAKAVVLDVGGRIFFDRWLEGSSAEWSQIIRLIAKKHRKRPLDGIILTIPADALLADNDALTRQKAILIASELAYLRSVIGMYLPCYVVISKMDMLTGFREYFMELDETMRNQIFGWTLKPSENYELADFEHFWNDTVRRLRDGGNYMMLSKSVLQPGSREEGAGRMDTAGNIFIFPESFHGLYRNLEVYLRTIFGKENYHGTDRAQLRELNFTSSLDQGVSLSSSLAELTHKPVDETPLYSPAVPHRPPLFIRAMLNRIFTSDSRLAGFLPSEQIRRNIPLYLTGLILLTLSFIWLLTPYLSRDSFPDALQPHVAYYNNIADMFDDGNIKDSPMIVQEQNGEYKLAGSLPVEGHPELFRRDFFYEAHFRLNQPVHAPFGFFFSRLVVFGLNRDLDYVRKAFIYNNIQSEMIYLPLVHAVQNRFLDEKRQEPMDKNKRDAIYTFLRLSHSDQHNWFEKMFGLIQHSDYSIMPFLKYLLPDTNRETMRLLDSYLPDYDWTQTVNRAQFLYTKEFSDAQYKAVLQWLNAWDSLNIYPQTLYALSRNAVRYGEELTQNYYKANTIFARTASVADLNDLQDVVKQWRDLVQVQSMNSEKLNQVIDRISSSSEGAASSITSLLAEMAKKESKGLADASGAPVGNTASLSSSLQLNIGVAIKNFESYLMQDFDDLEEEVEIRRMPMEKQMGKWTDVDMVALGNYQKRALQALQKQSGDIRQRMVKLRNDPIFRKFKASGAQNVKEDGTVANSHHDYQILSKIMNLSTALPIVDSKVSSEQLKTVWTDYVRSARNAVTEFDIQTELYKKDETLAPFISAARSMLLMQSELDKYLILDKMLNGFPRTSEQLSSRIEKNSEFKSILEISPELTVEAIGHLSVRKDYPPEVASRYLPLILAISGSVDPADTGKKSGSAENGKNASSNPVNLKFIARDPRYSASTAVIQEYFLNYVRFWGAYPETVKHPVKDWKSFRQFASTVKPYSTNAVLVQLYNTCLKILNSVDDRLLSKEGVKEKAEAIARLNDQLKVITPLFTDTCLRTMAAWAELPEDPEEAWRRISSMSEKELRLNLLAVQGGKDRADIPWWSNLTQRAVELLKNDLVTQLSNSFADYEKLMLCFPVCADSISGNSLSMEDMNTLYEFLTTLGIEPQKTTASAADGAGNNAAPAKKNDLSRPALDRSNSVFKDPDAVAWATSILTLADAMVNEKKPFIWQVRQPSAEMQNKLRHSLSPDRIPAMTRFRYVDAGLNDAFGARLSTSGKTAAGQADPLLIAGDASAQNLVIRFYDHANDTAPQGELNFSGTFPFLRLYLTPGSYYDPEQKVFYIPLTVNDRRGGSYVYFIGMTMNKVLPLPEKWPSLKDWPEFSSAQKTIRFNRTQKTDLTKLLNSAGTGRTAYEKLVRTLQTNDLNRYPELALTLTESTAKPTSAQLRYRYVELRVGGKPVLRVPTFVPAGVAVTPVRISLTEPELAFAYFEHQADSKPVRVVTIRGPYAPLNLITASARKPLRGSYFLVDLKPDAKTVLPVFFQIVPKQAAKKMK